MKKLFLLLLVSFISFSAFTQVTPTEKKAKKALDKWVEACNLDRKTQVALFIVLLEKQEAFEKAKEEHGEGSEEFKLAKKTIGKEYAIRIKNVVGPESSQRMTEYRKSHKDNQASI